MTEIEQLKKDIATLEAAQKLIADQEKNGSWLLDDNIVIRQQRLAKLEAEAAAKADPWKEEKESVAKLCEPEIKPFPALTQEETRRIRASHAARYVRHLEQRVAELEVRLTNWWFAWRSVDKVKDLAAAQARIAELEAQLSRRPVVWCDRLPDGDYLRKHCGWIQLFSESEKNNSSLVMGRFEPYTGEQK